MAASVLLLLLALTALVPGRAAADPAPSQTLVASNGAAGDWYGGAIAAATNSTAPLLLVSAFQRASTKGSVYVVDCAAGFSNCVQRAEITNAEPDDSFGRSVVWLNGGGGGPPATPVICSNHVDFSAGACYVYQCTTSPSWQCTQTARFAASDAEAGASLGVRSAVSGTVVIVGAGDATGKANDNFGFAMAVTDAHVVVVGAIRAQGATSDTAGAAFVYTCGGGQCDDCAARARPQLANARLVQRVERVRVGDRQRATIEHLCGRRLGRRWFLMYGSGARIGWGGGGGGVEARG